MKSRSRKATINRISGCVGKEPFGSFRMAKKTASRVAHRRGEAMQPYACTACGGFHVGSPNGKGRGKPRDSRQPYLVFAHNGDNVECFIGRSNKPDGGQLAEILRKDGWKVTRVI